MKARDALDRQRRFVAEQGDCHCLIHHPTDPKGRALALEMVRSGTPSQAIIGIQMLNDCPTRNKEN